MIVFRKKIRKILEIKFKLQNIVMKIENIKKLKKNLQVYKEINIWEISTEKKSKENFRNQD